MEIYEILKQTNMLRIGVLLNHIFCGNINSCPHFNFAPQTQQNVKYWIPLE